LEAQTGGGYNSDDVLSSKEFLACMEIKAKMSNKFKEATSKQAFTAFTKSNKTIEDFNALAVGFGYIHWDGFKKDLLEQITATKALTTKFTNLFKTAENKAIFKDALRTYNVSKKLPDDCDEAWASFYSCQDGYWFCLTLEIPGLECWGPYMNCLTIAYAAIMSNCDYIEL
jgi:hypothetical protein